MMILSIKSNVSARRGRGLSSVHVFGRVCCIRSLMCDHLCIISLLGIDHVFGFFLEGGLTS